METIKYSVWGANDSLVAEAKGSGRCRMTDNDYTRVDAVLRSIGRKTNTSPGRACQQGHSGSSAHYSVTLTRNGGGVVGQIWFSIDS